MSHLKSTSRGQLFVAATLLTLSGIVAIVPWRLAAQEPPKKESSEVKAEVNATLILAPNTFTKNIPHEPDHYVAPSGQTAATEGSNKFIGKIFAYAVLERKEAGGETKQDGGCIAINPNTGEWERISKSALSVRVSPKGGRLALSELNPASPTPDDFPSVFLMDAQTPKAVKIIDNCQFPAWSPDGDRLLYSRSKAGPSTGRRGPSWTYDLTTNKTEKVPIPETDEVSDWSLQGNWLVTISDRDPPFGRGYQLYIMHPDGTQQRRLTELNGLNYRASFRPGTNQVAYVHQDRSGDSLCTVDFDGSNRKEIVHGKTIGENFMVRWSPDGMWMAVGTLKHELDPTGNFKMPEANAKTPPMTADIAIRTANGDEVSELKLAGVTRLIWVDLCDWR